MVNFMNRVRRIVCPDKESLYNTIYNLEKKVEELKQENIGLKLRIMELEVKLVCFSGERFKNR